MRLSVLFRVITGYLVIILMLSAASLVAFTVSFRNFYRQSLSDNLKTVALALSPEVTATLANGNVQQLKDYVQRSGVSSKIRITVINVTGVVIADSLEDPRTMENHRDRPEVSDALKGSTGRAARFSSTTNQEALYVALPLALNNKLLGVLRTSMFVKDINFPPGLIGHIVNIGLVLAGLALVAAFFLSRSIWRPISELSAASEKLASGDYSTRVFLKRNDEFKALADTFNAMSREIESSFEELGHQKTELKSIIDSLKEGLVVVDKRGAIIYHNESFNAIIGREASLEGALYWEVFSDASFLEVMEKAKTGRINPLEEVEIRDKVFICSATRLEEQGETVLVLHDISSRKELDRIKRDLVSNVSHELRTPLTSIKGYAETLEDEVDEKNRHFVEIIIRNTNRLINIVRDLLLLSEMEEKAVNLEREDIDLKNLIDYVIRIFNGQAQQKGLSIKVVAPSNLPLLYADPFKIEQVLTNLLDNAIRYTDAGEITVTLSQDGQNMIVEVSDTGLGIPKDKVPHIFERFYVVDKSRSRKTGGTGLGLSIVKHIVMLHGGDVLVESIEGKGTRFAVRLPLSATRES